METAHAYVRRTRRLQQIWFLVLLCGLFDFTCNYTLLLFSWVKPKGREDLSRVSNWRESIGRENQLHWRGIRLGTKLSLFFFCACLFVCSLAGNIVIGEVCVEVMKVCVGVKEEERSGVDNFGIVVVEREGGVGGNIGDGVLQVVR